MPVKRAYGTPGGYVGREKVRKYNAVLLGYFAYSLVAAVLIWTFLADVPYATMVWVVLVLAPLATSVARRSLREPLRPLIAGLTGDREVSKHLQPILHAGYDVLDDVDLGRSSVDHIVLGPSGIYAIQTKRWGGRSANSEKQAVASAAAVRNRLAMCGLDTHVVAVVALARSTLPNGPTHVRHAQVVDARSLAMWIARRPTRLETTEIERARAALVPYV